VGVFGMLGAQRVGRGHELLSRAHLAVFIDLDGEPPRPLEEVRRDGVHDPEEDIEAPLLHRYAGMGFGPERGPSLRRVVNLEVKCEVLIAGEGGKTGDGDPRFLTQKTLIVESRRDALADDCCAEAQDRRDEGEREEMAMGVHGFPPMGTLRA
jgi:hypothetical protein